MYGENCQLMWRKLQSLYTTSDLPWLVIGDFNECLWDFEHLPTTPRPEIQMTAFHDVLEVCQLVDISFSSVPFTYDNKRCGTADVRVRLDRVVASSAWRNMSAFSSVSHVMSPCSNHVVLILKGAPDPGPSAGRQH